MSLAQPEDNAIAAPGGAMAVTRKVTSADAFGTGY